MKKFLHIPELREREVPAILDARILAVGALRARRNRRNRQVRWVAAAAVFALCAALGITAGLRQNAAPPPEMERLSSSELLALGDFSRLEQENFADDLLAQNWESGGDYRI